MYSLTWFLFVCLFVLFLFLCFWLFFLYSFYHKYPYTLHCHAYTVQNVWKHRVVIKRVRDRVVVNFELSDEITEMIDIYDIQIFSILCVSYFHKHYFCDTSSQSLHYFTYHWSKLFKVVFFVRNYWW